MCLAIPGKIIRITNNEAMIEYPNETRKARIVNGAYRVGDYVIAQAGMIIERIPKKQVASWNKFLEKESL